MTGEIIMTDQRNPAVESLFSEAQHDLDGEEFVARVMTRTRIRRSLTVAAWVCTGLVTAAGAWFLAIPVEVTHLISQVLTTTLIDLGDSWLAWLFSPVNNVAALFVIIVKAIRIGRKKIFGASFAS